jgi:hypothetical protein
MTFLGGMSIRIRCEVQTSLSHCVNPTDKKKSCGKCQGLIEIQLSRYNQIASVFYYNAFILDATINNPIKQESAILLNISVRHTDKTFINFYFEYIGKQNQNDL